jgi:hypothetical protein
VDAAVDAFYSSFPPTLYPDKDDVSYSYFQKVDNSWQLVIDNLGKKPSSFMFLVDYPTFAPCDEAASYFQGMELGFYVVFIWAIAFGFKVMAKML